MGGKGTLYYNAAAGPLPRAPRALKLKAGLNAWAEMLHAELAPVPELPGWWAADVELGEVGFKTLGYPYTEIDHAADLELGEVGHESLGYPLLGLARVHIAARMGAKGFYHV